MLAKLVDQVTKAYSALREGMGYIQLNEKQSTSWSFPSSNMPSELTSATRQQ